MSIQITAIYDAVCQCNDSRFLEALQRLSHNQRPKFTDQELITIILWGKAHALATRKAIYNLVKEVMPERFPYLPSYQAFSRRLNRIPNAFLVLADIWQERSESEQDYAEMRSYVMDSYPIVLAKNSYSNTAKVAPEMCHICHNAAKDLWYYGVKLHVVSELRPGTLPWPRAEVVSSANLSDSWAAKDIFMNYNPASHGVLYADKAYADASLSAYLKQAHDIRLLTPRKKKKYDILISGDAVSTFIASKRQPIESSFNWLNVHTGIQDAHYVRSAEGLLTHIFSSLATAAFLLRFNY